MSTLPAARCGCVLGTIESVYPMPRREHRKFIHAPRPAKVLWRYEDQKLIRISQKPTDGIAILLELVARLGNAHKIEKRDWIMK